MEIITVIIASIACILAGFAVVHTKNRQQSQINGLEESNALLEKSKRLLEEEKARLVEEKRTLELEKQAETYKKEMALQQLEDERRNNEQNLQRERESHSKRLDETKEQYNRTISELKENFQKSIEALKGEVKLTSLEILKQRGEELNKSNIEQIGTILSPIKEQMESVKKSMQDVNKETAANKASMDEKIKNLIEETNKVGLQADTLAKALKGNSKIQGDWGEQLLASILDNSGLREDIDYVTQENVKDENDKNLRPDVIVYCPGNKKIIIDSKVSLTAYVDYVNAQTEEEQERHKRANLDSVKKHIDELSAKNYPGSVPNSLSQVLMFIPNEGSYILALRSDPNIGNYAFKKNVLLINATNLMMALQLIYNLWQSEKQTKNIEKIVKESTGLYEKFATFLESWDKIKSGFNSLAKSVETTDKQLCSGAGNIAKRIIDLKKTGGLLPKKEIAAHYVEKAEEESPAL